eukprot:CAMPEP_0115028738 /NCGR_PEP_ID=MMETSP0216-20121206/36521_1 /TAXON_ID=223996 /ORGANISM="Protocruzia adherens, Strain Boccale" /LENGTH=202 /DNA_ID=CAMNT_0002405063 /DNA_START=1 /DNA_END=606 /DNA_ORIENTATION=+
MDLMKQCEKKLEELTIYLEHSKSEMNASDQLHSKNTLTCFYQKLNQIAKIISEFKKFRLRKSQEAKRRKERQQSVGGKLFSSSDLKEEKPSGESRKIYSVQDIQQENEEDRTIDYLGTENKELMIQYEEETDSLQQLQKSSVDLQNIIIGFSRLAHEQEIMSQSILSDATDSVAFIRKANENLVKSKEYSKGQGLVWAIVFL